MALIMCFLSLFGSGAVKNYRVEAPGGFGEYTVKETAVTDNADFYVSPTETTKTTEALIISSPLLKRKEMQSEALTGRDLKESPLR